MAAYPIAVLVFLSRDQVRRAAVAVTMSVVTFAVPAGLTWLGASQRSARWFRTLRSPRTGVPGLDTVTRPVDLFWYLGPAAALFAALVAAALAMHGPRARGLLALLVPLGLAVVAFSVLLPDRMEQLRLPLPYGRRPRSRPRWLLAVWPVSRCGAGCWSLRPRCSSRSHPERFLCRVQGSSRASPTAPMCSIAVHMGWSFNGYAALLDLDNATLATPDVGGAGWSASCRSWIWPLADAELAHLLSERDTAGFNDVLFARAPEFIELHDAWGIGPLGDPRLAQRYVEIRRMSPTDGVWVRRDLVTNRQLARLQTWDRNVAQPAERRQLEDAPRGSCGDRLVARPDPLRFH